MAITSTPPPLEVEAASSKSTLKCQTWVLKVSIHCQGCKKRVRKILQGINGVHTMSIDPEHQKVTVTGNVRVETLIKKLTGKGKHAEVWKDSNIAATTGKDDHQEKAKPATGMQDGSRTSKNKSTHEPMLMSTTKLGGEAKTGGNKHSGNWKQLEYSTAPDEKKGSERETACANDGSRHSSSGATGISSGSFQFQYCNSDHHHPSLNLAYQQQLISPQGLSFFPIVGYTNNMGAFFYVQPPPVGYSHIQTSTRLDSSLHIFSDENVNSCSIM